jgi:hypothetical protein
MGGVAACAMMGAPYAGFHSDIVPVQMDIVIPSVLGHPSPYSSWTRLLTSMEYQLCLPRPSHGPYAICVQRVELYKHAVWLLFLVQCCAFECSPTDHESCHLLIA